MNLKNEFLKTNYFNFYSAQLETDMKDKEMKFWTTSPNSFYVIRVGDDLNVKVLGIVAMQKRDETTVELNRLSVRPDVRGIGVGKKLVLTVIQVGSNFRKQILVKILKTHFSFDACLFLSLVKY